MARIDRLFQLMQALRSLPAPVTAEALAAETGVSQRTLYRDIDSLRGLGAVVDGAPGFGYTLVEDASLPPLGFEDEELEALVLGLKEVQAFGDADLAKAASQALGKLRARLPERQQHRLKHAVLTAHRFAPQPTPQIDARALRRACWDEAILTITYADQNGATTQREIKPLSIVYFQHSHCLLAYCALRDDFRAFRLDRISAFAPTGRFFRPNRVSLLRDCLAALRAQANSRNETR